MQDYGRPTNQLSPNTVGQKDTRHYLLTLRCCIDQTTDTTRESLEIALTKRSLNQEEGVRLSNMAATLWMADGRTRRESDSSQLTVGELQNSSAQALAR